VYHVWSIMMRIFLLQQQMHQGELQNSKGATFHQHDQKLAQKQDCKITVTLLMQQVGWLVFNDTFSTKRLYRAMQKLKVC